jgi:hypothetical protein
MKAKLAGIVTVLMTIVFSTGLAAAQGQYVAGTTGVDVSWPNCRALISKASFGVVGVSNGLGFSTNPCLVKEANHFTNNLSLYVNTGYPGATSNNAKKYAASPKLCGAADLNCIAYDYGYNAGLYASTTASNAGVHATTWWLDVETMNSWTSDALQNQNSLQGETDALKASGISTVGVYSTTAQWGIITAGWQNGLPSWGATTWTTAKQAATYCTGHQFTGGPSYLMQYKAARGIDQDYAC